MARRTPPSAPLAARVALRNAQARRNAAPNEANAAWEKLGLICSANERRADDASRDVEAWLKSYYMRERVGETFSGTVSSVAPFGVFIVLDDLYVEGLVHVSELGSEYFLFNEALHELRGERTGLRYRLGDRLTVQVARVDLEARRIEFRMVKGDTRKALLAGPAEPREKEKKRGESVEERRDRQAKIAQRREVRRGQLHKIGKKDKTGKHGAQGEGARGQAGALMTAKRILAGFHAVSARLRHAPETIEALYVDARRRDGRMAQLQQRAAELKVKVVAADPERLRGLAGEAPHQGVVAVAAHLDESLSLDDVVNDVGPGTLLLLLDGVTDPRNLGACLRVADAAGVQAVIVPRDRSVGLTPAALKAAAGAAEAVPLIAVTNLARAMDDLRDAGVRLVGAAGEAGQSLFDLDLTGPLAWVLGAEGAGLRRLTRERCDALASIPIIGQVESLNVSVATGICLYEAVRQRRASAA